jgi:hypothetical protein
VLTRSSSASSDPLPLEPELPDPDVPDDPDVPELEPLVPELPEPDDPLEPDPLEPDPLEPDPLEPDVPLPDVLLPDVPLLLVELSEITMTCDESPLPPELPESPEIFCDVVASFVEPLVVVLSEADPPPPLC